MQSDKKRFIYSKIGLFIFIVIFSISILLFLNKNIDNLKIEIKVKKGIWNHYILESWHIKEVLNH